MARQSFNSGTAPHGIGGDTNRSVNTKWEANFTELYKAMGAVFGGVNSGAPGAVLPTALPISNGGTGATTAASARSNLGLGALATLNSVSISNGGTGATSREGAARSILPIASAGQFVKFDGVNWVASADNNTTYSNMSKAEIEEGTSEIGRLIAPKDLKDAVGAYNAASSSKLQTPRKINGIDFDGTEDISFATMPIGIPLFHGGERSTIEVGYMSYDGQLLNRADYPAMWAKVQSTFKLIDDAEWLAYPSKRGSYSNGNGSTTFRMPDYNGLQPGSLKGLFLRGDGGGFIGGIEVSSGTVLSDAIRNITGSFGQALGNKVASIYETGATSGVFNGVGGSSTYRDIRNISTRTYSPGTYPVQFDFSASRVVPTAEENRPVSAVGVWICRVGDTLTEIANPTLHAVLTGGNIFDGSQQINGNLSVAGNQFVTGNLSVTGGLTVNGLGLFGGDQTVHEKMGERVIGAVYTNTSNYARFVIVRVEAQSTGLSNVRLGLYAADLLQSQIWYTSTRGSFLMGVVPPGRDYVIQNLAGALPPDFRVENWVEM